MAKMILKAAYLSLSANDLSGYTHKAELTTEVEEKEVTTYGSLGWKEVLGGIASGGLSLGFRQDVADNLLDEIMWGLFIAGTNVAFEVRLSNAVVGASNPKYTGLVLVKSWSPISGGVGDVAEVDVSYPTSGVVARAIA